MRSVRFTHAGEDYLLARTLHDGFKQLEPVMLFNLNQDPHEQYNLAGVKPDLATRGLALLAEWQNQQILTSAATIDPMMTVLRAGGPFHTRGTLPTYLARLRATGRMRHAERLARLHPDEL